MGNHNAQVQRWLELFAAFACTLEYRKGSANSTADFLVRLPEPVKEHHRSGLSIITSVDDDCIYLRRAWGVRALSSPMPGVDLGGLTPHPTSTALVRLLFTFAGFCEIRTHGARIKIDDISARLERFVARVSASVANVDRRPCSGLNGLAADTSFASVLVVATEGSPAPAEALAIATFVIPTTLFHGSLNLKAPVSS